MYTIYDPEGREIFASSDLAQALQHFKAIGLTQRAAVVYRAVPWESAEHTKIVTRQFQLTVFGF